MKEKMSKKKNITNLLVGILIGCVISTSVTVYGTTNFQTIQVLLNKVNLKVNGQPVQTDHILYNGTTYTPLRAVAEMLNKDVGWDADTNTASINDFGYVDSTQPINQGKSEFSFKEFSLVWYKIHSNLYELTGEVIDAVYCLNNDYTQVYVRFNPSLYIQGKTDVRVEGGIILLLALINGGYEVNNDNPYIDGTLRITDLRPYRTIGMSIKENIKYLSVKQKSYSYTYTYNNQSLVTPDTEKQSIEQDSVRFIKYKNEWLVNINDFLEYFGINNKVHIEYNDIASAFCYVIN